MRVNRALAGVLTCALLAGCTEPAAQSEQQSTRPNPKPAVAQPAPPDGVNGAATPPLEWSPCHDSFECATPSVPLDYHEPEGARVDLAVIRLPATNSAERIGSIVVNFGGPGSDGISELVRLGQRFPESLRAKFDVVSFDPRGIGQSSPIDCQQAQAPAGSPLRPEGNSDFYAGAAATGEACGSSETATMLPHMSSANVARDMELLRRAIGEGNLNYLGYSYGTYLGATYANLFPDKLRAMTLDGTLDLVANSTGRPGQEQLPVDVRADTAGAQLEELDRFFDVCTQAGSACAFGEGDPRQKYADIVARLSQEQAGGTTLSELLATVDKALQASGRWQQLAKTLQGLYASIHPEGAAASNPPLRDPYTPTHTPGYLAVQCIDSDNPQDPAAYDRLASDEHARVPYFGASATYNMAQCIGWPVHDSDRYLGPWNRQRTNPILVINNRHDPATPWHNAKAATEQLGAAHLLTVEGYGHTSLNVHSACASEAMTNYFDTLALPAPETTCAPDTQPFG